MTLSQYRILSTSRPGDCRKYCRQTQERQRLLASTVRECHTGNVDVAFETNLDATPRGRAGTACFGWPQPGHEQHDVVRGGHDRQRGAQPAARSSRRSSGRKACGCRARRAAASCRRGGARASPAATRSDRRRIRASADASSAPLRAAASRTSMMPAAGHRYAPGPSMTTADAAAGRCRAPPRRRRGLPPARARTRSRRAARRRRRRSPCPPREASRATVAAARRDSDDTAPGRRRRPRRCRARRAPPPPARAAPRPRAGSPAASAGRIRWRIRARANRAVGVRRIIDEGDAAPARGSAGSARARHVEQRPHEDVAAVRDTGQARDAGAANDAVKDGLRLVVGLVAERHPTGPVRARQAPPARAAARRARRPGGTRPGGRAAPPPRRRATAANGSPERRRPARARDRPPGARRRAGRGRPRRPPASAPAARAASHSACSSAIESGPPETATTTRSPGTQEIVRGDGGEDGRQHVRSPRA